VDAHSRAAAHLPRFCGAGRAAPHPRPRPGPGAGATTHSTSVCADMRPCGRRQHARASMTYRVGYRVRIKRAWCESRPAKSRKSRTGCSWPATSAASRCAQRRSSPATALARVTSTASQSSTAVTCAAARPGLGGAWGRLSQRRASGRRPPGPKPRSREPHSTAGSARTEAAGKSEHQSDTRKAGAGLRRACRSAQCSRLRSASAHPDPNYKQAVLEHNARAASDQLTRPAPGCGAPTDQPRRVARGAPARRWAAACARAARCATGRPAARTPCAAACPPAHAVESIITPNPNP